MLFVAMDDHAPYRLHRHVPRREGPQRVQFLRNAVAYYKSLDVKVNRLLTDNGPAFHSRDFAKACLELGVRHKFTRAYRPQTNGKAERFIQSALREWACGFTYQHSADRTRPWTLGSITTTGIGPIKASEELPHDRLRQSRNNRMTTSP